MCLGQQNYQDNIRASLGQVTGQQKKQEEPSVVNNYYNQPSGDKAPTQTTASGSNPSSNKITYS